MRKILIYILLLLSCNKEIPVVAKSDFIDDKTSVEIYRKVSKISQAARTGGGRFWYTGMKTLSVNNDKGVSATADVKKLQGGKFEMKSWWVAFNYIDTSGVIKWTQFGYGLHYFYGYITIIAFFQGSTEIYPPITYLNSPALIFGSKTKFSIYNVEGTTKWRYARNDIDVFEIDLEATAIYNLEIKIESQSSTFNLKWPQINVQNISSLKNGLWVNSPNGFGEGTLDGGYLIWPLAGKLQNPLLQNAELNMGYGEERIPSGGTQLW